MLRALPGRAALIDAIVSLGWFAADFAGVMAGCDLNPVRVYADRVLALDALIVLQSIEIPLSAAPVGTGQSRGSP